MAARKKGVLITIIVVVNVFLVGSVIIYQRQLREIYWLKRLDRCKNQECDEVIKELGVVGSAKSVKPILNTCESIFSGGGLYFKMSDRGTDLSHLNVHTPPAYRKQDRPGIILKSLKKIYTRDSTEVESILRPIVTNSRGPSPSYSFSVCVLFADFDTYTNFWKKNRKVRVSKENKSF